MTSPNLVIGNDIPTTLKTYRERVVGALRSFTTTNQSSEGLNKVFTLLGWRFEGQCFENLAQIPNAVRSPESLIFDGAVVVSCKEPEVDVMAVTNFADRILDLDRKALYVTFDLKSINEHFRVGLSHQIVRATIAPLMSAYLSLHEPQQALTQLFIYGPRQLPGMMAVVPWNYLRKESASFPSVAALASCPTWMFPFLMPNTPEWWRQLIKALIHHARRKTPFVNPWNGVKISHYTPIGVPNPFGGLRSTRVGKEFETYRILWSAINQSATRLRIKFDLSPYAPLLGDFVIWFEPTDSGPAIPVIIEQKRLMSQLIGGRLRLTLRWPAPIKGKYRWYIDSRRRWHMILFRCAPGSNGNEFCVLVPQSAIPDAWYTMTMEFIDAPTDWKTKYGFTMKRNDTDHAARIQEIIQAAYPNFRTENRPARPPGTTVDELDEIEEDLATLVKDIKGMDETVPDLPDDSDEPAPFRGRPLPKDPLHPEYTYNWFTTQGANILRLLNDVCALRRFGIFLPLDLSRAIFVACIWTELDVEQYMQKGFPPCTIPQLSQHKRCIILSLHDIAQERPDIEGKAAPMQGLTTPFRVWAQNADKQDRRIYVRPANSAWDITPEPRNLLLIPNEQMITPTGHDDTRNIAALLRPPLGEVSYKFEPEGAVDMLTTLLEGDDWTIQPTAHNGLEEEMVFSSDVYNISLREALERSAEDTYNRAFTAYFDPQLAVVDFVK